MYPLRAEKPGLHKNFTYVRWDRGCRSPIPGDVSETRGFALSVPKAKKRLKGLPCATHSTAQTSSNVSPTVELCPPHPTFGTKVRARRDAPEGKKKITIIHIHLQSEIGSQPTMCQVHTGAHVSLLAPGKTDYTARHARTTTYILHVVPITTHMHDRRKSIGKKKRRK